MTCIECNSNSSFVNQTFHDGDTIYLSGMNLTLTSNQTWFYQSLFGNSEGTNISFRCISNQSDSDMGVNLDISENTSYFTYLRLRYNRKSIAYIDTCGSSMIPYFKLSESGCSSYYSSGCSTDIFAGIITGLTNYTLLKQDIASVVPIWGQANKSCLYSANNQTSGEKLLIHAWRVAANGGQFCIIQNRWDWYIYSTNGSSTASDSQISTFPDVLVNESWINFNCSLYNNWTNAVFNLDNLGFGSCYSPPFFNVSAPNVTDDDDSGNWVLPHPEWFDIDWTKKLYLIILVLAFIIICMLLYFSRYFWAAFLTIIIGFMFLFSDVNWIISLIVIAMGILMAAVPKGSPIFVGGGG